VDASLMAGSEDRAFYIRRCDRHVVM